MNIYENVRNNLKESDNSMKDKFIEFKRQVHSDFEQFEEDMMNDDTDVFSGTEDSYANEMIWEHLSDTVYYLLENKFDTDRIYDLTNIFTSKLIDAYNENKLDDEIGRVFATYMHGLNESEYQVVMTIEKYPGVFETKIYDTYDSQEQASDAAGELRAQGINCRVVPLMEAAEIGYDDYYAFGAEDNEDTLYCDECGQPVKPDFCYVSDESDPNPEIYCWPCHDRLVAHGALMEEAENNNAAYVICYGTLEIWPDRDSAREYYEEGVAMCEGAEQQRYGNIAFALYKGNNFADDEGPEMVTEIVDKNADGSDKLVRTNCGKMTHEQAFDYITKLHGSINESEESNLSDTAKVLTFDIEDTGGHVIVGYGKLSDGTYYSISSDVIFIWDTDWYKLHFEDAEESGENYDDPNATIEDELDHMIKYYEHNTPEYKMYADQCVAMDENKARYCVSLED